MTLKEEISDFLKNDDESLKLMQKIKPARIEGMVIEYLFEHIFTPHLIKQGGYAFNSLILLHKKMNGSKEIIFFPYEKGIDEELALLNILKNTKIPVRRMYIGDDGIYTRHDNYGKELQTPILFNKIRINLKEILEKEGKYAVVGLPCHICGMRKAEEVSRTLRERVAFHLGIFCSHTVNFGGTEFLLGRLGIRNEDVAGISYRGGGWPGMLKISLKNGDEKALPGLGSLWNSIFGSFLFTPACCLSCGDVTNELADISFGDPWLPEVMRRGSTGESVVISRSKRGEALLRAASAKGAIELENLSAKDAVRSQRLFLHFKKVNISYRMKLRRVRRRRVDAVTGSKTSICNYLVGAVAIMNSRLGASGFGAFLLKSLPLKALAVYNYAFYRCYFRVINKYFAERR